MRILKDISLNNPSCKGKVVMLQLLVSRCPNCMDETPFLSQLYKDKHTKGVEIIGVYFERTADFAASKKSLNSFFNRFKIPYPVIFSGVAANDSLLTEKAFPGLSEKIHTFPTLIFIDKFGFVRKIHSGINGPATGAYFGQFKEEAKATVNGLLKE